MNQSVNLLDIVDLAEMFKVNKASIYRWISTDGFPAPLKVGSLSRWELCSVLAYIQSKRKSN